MKAVAAILFVVGAANAGLLAPALAPATVIARAPALDSAVIKSDRLGGNFAYSVSEAHAYTATSPVIQHVATPVAVSYSAPAIHHVAAPAVVAAPAPVIARAAPAIHVAAPAVHHVAAPAVIARAAPAVVAAAPALVAAPAAFAHHVPAATVRLI